MKIFGYFQNNKHQKWQMLSQRNLKLFKTEIQFLNFKTKNKSIILTNKVK